MTRIVTHLTGGGLGNQLFAIFTTIAYAIKKNRQFIFPYKEILENCYIQYYRKTYWLNFLENILHCTTFSNDIYSSEYLHLLPRYNEAGYTYTEIPDISNEHIAFTGCYQSYKYFEQQYHFIAGMIGIPMKLRNVRMEFPEYFPENRHIVSMHFRLGDYKLKPKQHPILSFQYYDLAIREIMNRRAIENPLVLVCCEEEDNEHVANVVNRLKGKYNGIDFMKIKDDIEDWKQLLLMSCCRDNIIANSTFSWWSAYFNEHLDKVVVTPNRWSGDENHDISDLIPENWIKII